MADRRALVGVLIFFGLVLACFGFGLLIAAEEMEDVEEGPQVGVVQVETVITDSTAREGIKALRKFRKDEEIKAIVVRVDSPGGLVGPSQELYREITRTRKTKPVVASLGSVAASGGYYIASACDHIVASPGTITGSIGVISQTTQVQDLLALARIQTHTFKSGKYKDTGSPTRAMTEEDKAFMQGFVDQVHRQFVRDVAKGRKLDPARVKRVADGRILTGEQAKAHKLVDSLGNYSDALERAVKLAKATGEPVEVTTRRSKGLLSRLLDDAMESVYERARQALTQGTSLEVRDPRLR